MGTSSDLLAALDELRQRTARFRRIVLHVHSPDSHDWNRSGDKALNDGEKFRAPGGEREFINELKTRFDLVAITDHMKCSYACRVSAASKCHTDFLVLPGTEVNLRPEAALTCSRLHILAILPEGCSAEGASRLFAGLNHIPDDNARTGNEEIAGVQLADWVARVHREGGICIAAHVDARQGVRHHFRQTGEGVIRLLSEPGTAGEQERDLSDELKEFLLDAGFDAIEIAKSSDRRHYRWRSTVRGREIAIPVVLQLDAHCIEDFDRSDRVTWIKMTNLSLSGLRDALKFPETRIRFPSDLPTPPSPRLLGLEIIGDSNSLFENERIAFAENLNCLIGPRGSGKSTIVEALRYVFGYNRTLKELDSTNKLSERIRDMQRVNLSGSLIRVVYQTQSAEKRVLEATFDPQEDYATKVLGTDGEQLAVADVEKSGEYPLRLFGWSEIETLGRDTSRQRDLLDRLVPELPAAKQERDALREQLRANSKDVEKLANGLKALLARQNGAMRRYTEHKQAFDKLNTEEVQKHFKELDVAQAKAHVLELVRRNVDAFAARVRELDVAALHEGLDDLLSSAPQPLRDWWLADEASKLRLVDSKADVDKYLSSAVQVLRSLSELLGHHLGDITGEIEAIQGQIRASFSDDASMQKIGDLRANAERRLREVSALRDEYIRAWKRLQDVLITRDQVADTLIGVHDRIAGIRARYNKATETTLNQHFEGHMRVSLRFEAGRDTAQFAESLVTKRVASAFATQYRNRRIADILAAHFNPISLVRAIFAGDASAFAGRQLPEDPSARIDASEAQKALESLRPWAADESAQVEVLTDGSDRLSALLAVQEVQWDDEESILLNDRPVGELSPGQRSSAMLPLIALSESTPLVIDQPEDNLDNRLIGHVLADILAALKEQRQIIVCTHNPNIVVSGDAEQVIVLNAVRRLQTITFTFRHIGDDSGFERRSCSSTVDASYAA